MYAHAESTVASLSTEKASEVRPAEAGPVNSDMPPIGNPPPSKPFTASFVIGSSLGACTACGDNAAGIRDARLLSISRRNAALRDCIAIVVFAFCSLSKSQHTLPFRVEVNLAQ